MASKQTAKKETRRAKGKWTYALALKAPILTLPTSSLPSTISTNTILWCSRSMHPPRPVAWRRVCVVWRARSSGVDGIVVVDGAVEGAGEEGGGRETSSEACSAPVVDSARSVRP